MKHVWSVTLMLYYESLQMELDIDDTSSLGEHFDSEQRHLFRNWYFERQRSIMVGLFSPFTLS